MKNEQPKRYEGIATEATPFVAFWMLRILAAEEPGKSGTDAILETLLALYSLRLSDTEKTSIESGEELPLGRIIFASTNPRKHRGVERLRAELNSIFGQAKLTDIVPVRVPGDEPDHDQAEEVARHKVETLLEELTSNREHSALYPELNHRSVIFSSDVVAKIVNSNGEAEHLLNLSRVTDAGDLVHVGEFIEQLKRRYATGPFTLQYDIANAATMVQKTKHDSGEEQIAVSEHIRTEAVRVSISFRQIPEVLIQKHFDGVTREYASGQELREANIDPGINVGLPMFDEASDFLEYIESVKLESLSKPGDTSWFEPYEVTISELTPDQQAQLFNSLMVWITHGIGPTAPMLLQ